MHHSPKLDTEVIDGITFELRPQHQVPTSPGHVCLRKNRPCTDRYLALAEEFTGCRMVEVGVDQGGSTSFFTTLLKPEKLVALELSTTPVSKVTEFLARHDPRGRVEIHWGVDQADRVAVPATVDRAMGRSDLDLVVDDASHLLRPSTDTFEMLFPRLRANGLYVLEDWSNDHRMERTMVTSLERDPGGNAFRHIASTLTADFKRTSPMSVLICQLVLAAAYRPDWIADLRVSLGICEVRRGPGEIPMDTPLAQYIGPLGEWVFAQHMG
ncbi:MAG: class I SAM-dependent methyltransferase [Halioglobus sp.]|nr:class I SAM-dependent methyltransferase [Halioglobus sp.]